MSPVNDVTSDYSLSLVSDLEFSAGDLFGSEDLHLSSLESSGSGRFQLDGGDLFEPDHRSSNLFTFSSDDLLTFNSDDLFRFDSDRLFELGNSRLGPSSDTGRFDWLRGGDGRTASMGLGLPLLAASATTAEGWFAGPSLGELGSRALTTIGRALPSFTELGITEEWVLTRAPALSLGTVGAFFTGLLYSSSLGSDDVVDPNRRADSSVSTDTPLGAERGQNFERGPQIPTIYVNPANPGPSFWLTEFPAVPTDPDDSIFTHPSYLGPSFGSTEFPAEPPLDWRDALTGFPALPPRDPRDSILSIEKWTGGIPSYGEKEMADTARKFRELTRVEQSWWEATAHIGRNQEVPEFLAGLQPPLISTSEIGGYVGEGGERTVFSLASDSRQVIGVFQDNSVSDWLAAYRGVEGLRTFEKAGLPTVNPRYPVQVVLHQGSEGDFARYFDPLASADIGRPFPAVIHDRYVLSSKDLYKLADVEDAVGGYGYYFQVTDAASRVDERSLEDLQQIRDWLRGNPVWLGDTLQFGIFEDGSLGLTDTGYVEARRPADRMDLIEKFDLKMLDFLEEVFRGELKPGDLYGPYFYVPPWPW